MKQETISKQLYDMLLSQLNLANESIKTLEIALRESREMEEYWSSQVTLTEARPSQ